MRWITILVLLGAAAAGCTNTAGEPPRGSTPCAVGQADLPVADVWLYPSGVAYVEHRGLAGPGSAFELRLKSNQVDSAMKRVIVQVGDDQQPVAIVQSLDRASSQITQTRRIELSNNLALPALLEQLRGGSVRLICARETIDATIISLEKKEQTSGDKRVEGHLLNILAAGSIRAVPLDIVQRVELTDPRLRQELTRALETPWEATDDDHKTITIPLQAKFNQPVRIAYTIDSTAWKPSYRLVLSQAPRLQLWATLTNDTDYDWNQVQLNLMCGRPMVGDSDSLSDSASADRAARGSGVTPAEPLQWPKTIPSREALDSKSSNAARLDAPPSVPPPSRSPAPLVNACKPPGEWQTYDIIFESPRWDSEGKLVKKANVTVMQNGLVLHHRREYFGATDGIGGLPHPSLGFYGKPHPPELFIELQDHANPVRYRNIWVRNLGEYDKPL